MQVQTLVHYWCQYRNIQGYYINNKAADALVPSVAGISGTMVSKNWINDLLVFQKWGLYLRCIGTEKW